MQLFLGKNLLIPDLQMQSVSELRLETKPWVENLILG